MPRKNPDATKLEAGDVPRFDPDDAPIDGDFQKDQVFGKDPSKIYALVHPDDMPVMRGRGYQPTVRTPDGPRPVYDSGSPTDPNYMVDNLMLMEIPRERADRIQAAAERRGSARWKNQQAEFEAGSRDPHVTKRTERNEHSVMTQ